MFASVGSPNRLKPPNPQYLAPIPQLNGFPGRTLRSHGTHSSPESQNSSVDKSQQTLRFRPEQNSRQFNPVSPYSPRFLLEPGWYFV